MNAKRGPAEAPLESDADQSNEPQHGTRFGFKTEYRVVYRRYGWRQPQTRSFGTEKAAVRLVEKLTGEGCTDLALIDFLRVDTRQVESRWTEGETVIDEGRRLTW